MILFLCWRNVLSGSRWKSYQTLNFICRFHELDKYSLSASSISKIQDVSTESDIFTAELVLDFLGFRSIMPDDPGINDDVIQYLCTSCPIYMYIFLKSFSLWWWVVLVRLG